jgi:pimeloyl-ACP methyl ester carboxylesterase
VKLVFVHGAGCTPAAFAAQLAAFPGSTAIDLHALAPNAATVGDYARALGDLLRAIDEPFALVGSSMGAATALEATIAGATAAAVVAIGCAPRLRVAPPILASVEADFDAFAASMPTAFFGEPTPALVAEARRELHEVGPVRTLADFRACDAWDLGDRAAGLSVPMLVLTGERDVLTPVKFGQALVDRVPDARMRILERAGHLAMAERPAETNDAIRAFVLAE